MPITLAAAAKLCGVDKSTLRRAVRSGRISGVRDDFGVWQVEICEVERVFPLLPSAPELEQGSPEAVPRNAVGTDAELAARAALEQQVAGLKELVEELRRARDGWQAQAERLALMRPTSVPQETAAAPPSAPKRRMGWVKRDPWRPWRRAG